MLPRPATSPPGPTLTTPQRPTIDEILAMPTVRSNFIHLPAELQAAAATAGAGGSRAQMESPLQASPPCPPCLPCLPCPPWGRRQLLSDQRSHAARRRA